MSFVSVTVPLTPRSQGATWRGPGGSSVCSGCASQLTNVKLRAPKSHIMDCKQTFPLPRRESWLCLPRLLAVQASWKRQSETQGQLAPLLIKCAETPETRKDCLLTKSSLATASSSHTVLPPCSVHHRLRKHV